MSDQPAALDAETVLNLRDRALMARRDALRPVLIVLHQETSTPGRVGNALRAMGYPLDVRRPRFGDSLPATLAGHAGVVVFGGPMSANDPDDYIRREIDWIAVPLRERCPFLGICLGAQMLAMHLGARVAPHPEGRVQIGYYPIRSGRPPPAIRFARAGPRRSITGIAKGSPCQTGPNCSRRRTTFRCRRCESATPSAFSSIRM